MSWAEDGLLSAPEVPADVQARVRAATLTTLADLARCTRMLDTGFDVGLPTSQEEMARGLKGDYEPVGAALKSIGFKPE